MRLIPAVVAAVSVWFLVLGGPPLRLPRIGKASLILGGAGLGVFLAVGVPSVLAVGAGLSPIVVSQGISRIRHMRTRRDTVQQWPDFLAVVRGRIATGEPLTDAVRVAARSIGGEIAALDRSWGGDFSSGLAGVQAALADATADRVLTTVRIAAATGGARVDAILSALTASLSDEMRLRRAHEAAVAQQQMTAGVALLAPWLILALSISTNPQAASEFSTSSGHAILWTGTVTTAVGYILARRAARLSRPPRLFT